MFLCLLLYVCFCVLFNPLCSSRVDGQKRKKSLRRKLDSLSKEKKDRGTYFFCINIIETFDLNCVHD